jgi:hypothetical protein
MIIYSAHHDQGLAWAGLAAAVFLLLACCGLVFAAGTEQPNSFPKGVRVLDLEGRSVDPFAVEHAKGVVLIFVSLECPISNSYVPEYERLNKEFSSKGLVFRLIYPNIDESTDAIQKHLTQSNCSLQAFRDPHHDLVKAAQVQFTPETAVLLRDYGLVYHGRIDNRYAELGKARPAATSHDLKDVLAAIVDGKTPKPRATPVVGCRIFGPP